MCSHYEAIKSPHAYKEAFNVEPPSGLARTDIWPGYESAFIRRPKEFGVGDDAVPAREAVRGVFGLVPHWAEDLKIAKRTYNARSETVATKPSFRDAWKWAKHCIIPADAIYEPDWRSGKAIATRIARADDQPMGIAGLWSVWKGPEGEVHSFTMLTVNATDHPLMKNFHKPDAEKRMIVILQETQYDGWLDAPAQNSFEFLRQYPAGRLVTDVAV